MELANGEKRVWYEVVVDGVTEYDRPESQGGSWGLANRMKIIRRLFQDDVNEILQGVR
jgi:hypothetical protein